MGSGEQLGPVNGQLMADISEKLRLKAAGGPDGWRAPEVRVLPDWIWHRAAQLCDVAEKHGEWPAAMRQGTVALIPKEGATNTGELRPIVVLPFFYRIWAASSDSEERGKGRNKRNERNCKERDKGKNKRNERNCQGCWGWWKWNWDWHP